MIFIDNNIYQGNSNNFSNLTNNNSNIINNNGSINSSTDINPTSFNTLQNNYNEPLQNSFKNLQNGYNSSFNSNSINNNYNNYEPIYNTPSNYSTSTASTPVVPTIIGIIILLALVYFNFIMPIFSKASNVSSISSSKSKKIHEEILSEIKDNSTSYTTTSNSAVGNVKSYEELVQFVYKKMLEGKTEITINYTGNGASSLIEIFKSEKFRNDICAIDDKNTTRDYDYMFLNAFGFTYKTASSPSSAQIKLNIMWYETSAQTDYVDKYSKALIDKLKLNEIDDNKTKMKTVHDYIIAITSYDHDYADNKDSLPEDDASAYAIQSAYNLITKGTTVCTGYSLLYYKVLTDLNIDCKIVTSETHAWNLVKLDDKWYHVDLTWDDTDFGIFNKQYFLKGSSAFENDSSHKLEDRYTTSEFTKAFPISSLDY